MGDYGLHENLNLGKLREGVEGLVVSIDGKDQSRTNYSVRRIKTWWRIASGVLCPRKMPIKWKGKFSMIAIKWSCFIGQNVGKSRIMF